ncbi:MAG: histone deacetylase [Anaerolineae bacterium]
MKAFYTDIFVLPLPDGHRFPMAKYAMLREQVATLDAVEMHIPPAATDVELIRVHTLEYVSRVQTGHLSAQEIRRIGFPWSLEMVERSRRSSGATIAACRAAIVDGTAVNLAGGTHHAFADRGGGYCVFNDAAIAARAMQAEGFAKRVLIVDCDVHQGDGTAAIFRDDPSVYTFSIHGENNYPFHKEQGDLDIALPDGTSDDVYLAALADGLAQAVEHAQAEAAIYVAGADAHLGDRLGKLKLTKEGMARRDRMVLSTLRAAGLPIAVTMGGGYGKRVEDTVAIHFQTVQIALEYAAT